MRKVLISLLLAGAAATPAIAGPHDWSDRSSAKEERQQERDKARDDRQSSREERQSSHEERGDRSNKVDVRANVNAPARLQAVGRADQRDVNATRSARQDARQDRSNFAAQNGGNYAAPGPRVVDPRVESLRERQVQARDQRIQERELRQSSRPTPAVVRTHPPVVSNTPRPGTQPPLRTESRHGGDHHWDTNWRHNGRYDWQNYRHHHRSIFRLGFYYDPYGWGYQPFSIGWRLWPSYYGRNYWINDPWYYHLPYAPAGYVWVRYWNDALLVDTWSGTVVDVIPGFFW